MAYAMVAAKAGNSKIFQKQEIRITKPKKGEALIRHTAIGVNFIDIYQRTGLSPAPGGFQAILGGAGAGDADRNGAEREPEVVADHLPKYLVLDHELVVIEADEDRRPQRRTLGKEAVGQRRHGRVVGEGDQKDRRRHKQQPTVYVDLVGSGERHSLKRNGLLSVTAS